MSFGGFNLCQPQVPLCLFVPSVRYPGDHAMRSTMKQVSKFMCLIKSKVSARLLSGDVIVLRWVPCGFVDPKIITMKIYSLWNLYW